MEKGERFKINRAPVLTLWSAIVAQRLGFDHDKALTLGRAVAGLNAQSKCKRLGIFKPSTEGIRDRRDEQRDRDAARRLQLREIPFTVTDIAFWLCLERKSA